MVSELVEAEAGWRRRRLTITRRLKAVVWVVVRREHFDIVAERLQPQRSIDDEPLGAA